MQQTLSSPFCCAVEQSGSQQAANQQLYSTVSYTNTWISVRKTKLQKPWKSAGCNQGGFQHRFLHSTRICITTTTNGNRHNCEFYCSKQDVNTSTHSPMCLHKPASNEVTENRIHNQTAQRIQFLLLLEIYLPESPPESPELE